MLRVALVDDEPLAIKRMRRLLADHDLVEVVGEADRVDRAVPMLRTVQPHAVFLDIGLPGLSGFELLSRIEPRPQVVFVTAHAGHAVRAFEVEALDYLLKPVSPSRLTGTLARLRRACDLRRTTELPEVLSLRTGGGRSIVTLPDRLLALLAEADFTRVLVEGEGAILVHRSLKSFAEELPNPPFLRLDRSLIINRLQLRRMEFQGRNGAIVWLGRDDQQIPLGRAAAARLRSLDARDARAEGQAGTSPRAG